MGNAWPWLEALRTPRRQTLHHRNSVETDPVRLLLPVGFRGRCDRNTAIRTLLRERAALQARCSLSAAAVSAMRKCVVRSQAPAMYYACQLRSERAHSSGVPWQRVAHQLSARSVKQQREAATQSSWQP